MCEDDWYAQDEYLCEPEVFHGFVPTSYDIGYTQSGNFIQFEFGNDANGFGTNKINTGYADCDKRLQELRKWLEIPKSTWKKIDVNFINDEHNNTHIEFELRAEDGENLLSDDMYGDGSYTWDEQALMKEEFYPWDITFVQNAMIKFDKMMDDALDNLEKAYEYQCSDENIIEVAEANDYEFDENGNQI
tara:strand:- start:323 stop:889 length:567 start_codon:yes stop_codon:yes gene_type:complete